MKALARAFRYQRLLDEGQYASITEMAEAERLDRGHMGRLLQLTLLAPEIMEANLEGSAWTMEAIGAATWTGPAGQSIRRSALQIERPAI